METTLKLILEALYCLVALGIFGFILALTYTDIKKDQRDEEIAWHREEEYHRKQMESFLK
ncbi:hypothetical protein LK430_08530 [Acidaminococcus fermentans DSM 20731]|uniref:Uncharacterized protein n=1 Tax=Acidaminococcus fermentans (strain ATCC 25085 / DSM 20731 / CCUG 9996 / CIP 106432 / VR4) TaxID=591001 RepID=D2RK97_ACIFV|nr:hypothetical protein [Acidaminococcus fermentans]ADB47499.1 hypothetical protein Acfer_1132 [Acidaminococcus fermentans DSM 20731]UEA71886.1 hypothetical protein LK430_08530 [Acidaminococcus fermentans DSM 20731]